MVNELPDDTWQHCLEFAIGSVTDLINASFVNREWRRLTSTCSTAHFYVDVSDENYRSLCRLHSYWQCIESYRPISASTLTHFFHSLRSVYLVCPIENEALLALAEAPTLSELHAPYGLTEAGLVDLLRRTPGLTTLNIPFSVGETLSRVLPPQLVVLKAGGLSIDGLHCLPSSLEKLHLSEFCWDLALLNHRCPRLGTFVYCSRETTQCEYLDFSLFLSLKKLILLVRTTYTLPSSLRSLYTMESNLLLGPIPHLQHLILSHQPQDTPSDNNLMRLPSLESFQTNRPLSEEILQQLGNLSRLGILHQSNPLRFYQLWQLRDLHVSCCSNPIFFYHLSTLDSLRTLTISRSLIDHAVVHRLLKMLPLLDSLVIFECRNVCTGRLQKRFPMVIVEYFDHSTLPRCLRSSHLLTTNCTVLNYDCFW
jgi:hypothetical protein